MTITKQMTALLDPDGDLHTNSWGDTVLYADPNDPEINMGLDEGYRPVAVTLSWEAPA